MCGAALRSRSLPSSLGASHACQPVTSSPQWEYLLNKVRYTDAFHGCFTCIQVTTYRSFKAVFCQTKGHRPVGSSLSWQTGQSTITARPGNTRPRQPSNPKSYLRQRCYGSVFSLFIVLRWVTPTCCHHFISNHRGRRSPLETTLRCRGQNKMRSGGKKS